MLISRLFRWETTGNLHERQRYSLTTPGGGGSQQSFIRGGSDPRSNSFPFITIFDRKGSPFIYLPLKNGTPFTYWYRTSHSRAVASSGGGQGGKLPPGPVEADKSCLWMDLFSLDSVILVIVKCNCLPFSCSRSLFRRHILWQVLKITFRSLQIWKFSEGIPPDPPTGLVLSSLAIMPPPPHPRYKRPSYGPAFLLTSVNTLPLRIWKSYKTRKFSRIFNNHKFFFKPV